MADYSCKQLMVSVRELALLKSWTDSALDKFDPTNGLLAMEKARKILARYEPLITYGNKLLNLYSASGMEDLRQRTVTVKVGGMTGKEIGNELLMKSVTIDSNVAWAMEMVVKDDDFKNRQTNPEEIILVRIPVRKLGFENDAKPDLVIARARQFGLDLCPIETGPMCLLQDVVKQRIYDCVVATKCVNPPQYRDSKMVFRIVHDTYNRRLKEYHMGEHNIWRSGQDILFRVMKVSDRNKE
jgi:hypothetical protein